MLLIVMYESQTWRVHPGELFTFGRGPACGAVLPAADRGVSRTAGSFRHHEGSWWLHNDSTSSVLCVVGDRGFRVDLPPGLQVPLQQWHAKVTLNGTLDRYVLRLRLPDLDDVPDPAEEARALSVTGERAVTSTRHRAPLTASDRLVLAAREAEPDRIQPSWLTSDSFLCRALKFLRPPWFATSARPQNWLDCFP